jgi:hypothetical protein
MCGAEVEEEQIHCNRCGHNLKGEAVPRPSIEPSGAGYRKKGAGDHLSTGFNVSFEKPLVFLPTIIGGVLGAIISFFSSSGSYGFVPSSIQGFLFAGGILSLISSFIIYILTFASIDMSRDAYFNQPLDLSSSISYVLSRFLTFFLGSILGVLMSITIILIPVVSLMFVIIVMDETGVTDALSSAFKVLGYDLGDVIIIIIVSIIGSLILGLIPVVGSLLNSALSVIISLAFIDLYYSYKQANL